MYAIAIIDNEGTLRDERIGVEPCLIGRARECALRLAGWRVGKTHARLYRTQAGVFIEDLGQLTGTWVNGTRVVQHGPLGPSDEIVIGPYRLRLREGGHEAAGEQSAACRAPGAPPPGAPLHSPARLAWRQRVHELLLDTMDLRRKDISRLSDAELRAQTDKLIREIIDSLAEIPAEIDREALAVEVLDEAVGLGPLEALLADESVTEIMVNRADEIYVERAGRLESYPLAFSSERVVMGVIERIVAPLGRRIDESSPMVDARLKDGSRVNAIIPPLALKGPTLTIRKFARRRLAAEDMVAFGSLSPEMVAFLRVCVEQRKSIVVSGGTASGKTTFLNVLSNFIPDHERIITIEDAAELKLHHAHLVSLEARPANLEGRGQVTIRELVRNALRMRPDRIVVGECRGAEALDMLQAMNTGHEGSLTTLHANSPRDVLSRLETMILMAGMDLPLSAIREQIGSAVNIILQQTRFACGSRRITHIVEVTGIESGKIQLQELFRFVPKGFGPDGRIRGEFRAANAVPSFYEALSERGIALDLSIFGREEGAAAPRH